MTWFAIPPPVELGDGWSLGFLTAGQMLECRGEGEAMASEERDKALWANAALLSKALLKEGKPAFEGGEEVLASLTVGQIEGLTRRWWQQDSFDRQPFREEGTAREGGENERFDMARFLELGGTEGELSQDPVWEKIVPAGRAVIPELWPRSGLPTEAEAEAQAGGISAVARKFAVPELWVQRGLSPEVPEGIQRADRRPYVLPGAPVPPRGGQTEETESFELPSDGQAGEEPTLAEMHRVVQALEPETVPEGAGLTVGELDRAVERDARRYGGGFSLL